jgi:serine phosphatase RsbU (regulator of sigma subunit)
VLGAMALKSSPGDLFLPYSDGISEMLDPSGNELGRSGLMKLEHSLDRSSPQQFGIHWSLRSIVSDAARHRKTTRRS